MEKDLTTHRKSHPINSNLTRTSPENLLDFDTQRGSAERVGHQNVLKVYLEQKDISEVRLGYSEKEGRSKQEEAYLSPR